jgi:hypothetical protein
MPAVKDVTEKLLSEVSGPGENVKRVQAAKAAKTLTPTLVKTLDEWNRKSDKSIGYTSNALAYGFKWIKPSQHTNLIRLIKGGHLRACQVDAEQRSLGLAVWRSLLHPALDVP